MARSFSNSEYIDIVRRVVKSVGVLRETREFPCDFSLWGYMKDLVHSIRIDTIEVLRKQVENGATTIRNNRDMLESVEESFRRRLHYCILITAITLNISCKD
jgi:hypothetical protein